MRGMTNDTKPATTARPGYRGPVMIIGALLVFLAFVPVMAFGDDAGAGAGVFTFVVFLLGVGLLVGGLVHPRR